MRHLEDSTAAGIVRDSLTHFAGKRYDLLAWVVMPSHVHWVFRPLDEWVATLDDPEVRTPRERILRSVNSHSGSRCNTLLGQRGRFWQPESYDHVVRDEEELERIVQYIHANPVKAGLVRRAEDYEFSSAREHFDAEH